MSAQQNDALFEEINRISKKYGISVENVTSQEFQKDIELLANNIQQNQKVRINRKTAVHYVPPTCIQMQETPEEMEEAINNFQKKCQSQSKHYEPSRKIYYGNNEGLDEEETTCKSARTHSRHTPINSKTNQVLKKKENIKDPKFTTEEEPDKTSSVGSQSTLCNSVKHTNKKIDYMESLFKVPKGKFCIFVDKLIGSFY